MEVKEPPEFKSIKVSDETHSRLAKLGTVSQTFEDVIKSLLDEHDEREKSNVKSKKWTLFLSDASIKIYMVIHRCLLPEEELTLHFE